MMPLYFAYGSNMNGAQMRNRCPSAKPIEKGRLCDYQLGFTKYSKNWGGGAADAIMASGSNVWGLIYELSEQDLCELDRREGTGYERLQKTISTDAGGVSDVWVYFVVSKVSFIPPTKGYLEIIISAAKELGFPKEYLSFISSFPTAPPALKSLLKA